MEVTSYPELPEEQAIDLRNIIKKCLHHWYWFIIGLLIAFSIAYAYLRYTAPVYQTEAELLIKDDKGGISASSGSALQNDVLGQLSMLAGNSNVQNEMAILSSRTIVGRAIRDLGFQTSYFIKGRVKSKEIYKKTPVLITPVFLKDSIHTQEINVALNPDRSYTVSDEHHVDKVEPGGSFTLDNGIFLIRRNPDPVLTDSVFRQITVTVTPLSAVISRYQKDLTLTQTDKTSSVIQMTLKTTVPWKGEDFLNTLIREYMLAGLADKNKTASNTIAFVDGRLDSVSNDLTGVENKLQQFLSASSIANLDEQSKVFVDQASQLDQQILQQQMQTAVLNQILQYVNQPEKAHNLVPSTLGIPDPVLLGLVKNYNELQLKRTQQLQAGAGPANPLIAVIDEQLNKLRNDIKTNTANLIRGSDTAAAKLQEQNQEFNAKIRNVPKVQREYINIKRQQDIKQTLYLYLLQKREEAAITEAANVSNSRIVDPAHTGIIPIAPKTQLIYLAAFLLGLALPGGLLYLKELLNRKVSSRQDVESHTQTPVYAEIGHSRERGPIIVASGAKGAVPEQFRNLRTNLSFVLGTGAHKIILVTSSMGGEGKSFVSLNLAMTYALMGKRTVLVDMDLRKPKLSAYLGLDHRSGISNYLSGQLSAVDLTITLEGEKDPLYFIGSGPVPPNPSELFLQPEMEKIIADLKASYDYIIIDTPPAGLVTDAQIIGKYADASIYIVRNGYTFRDQIRLLDSYYQGKRFPHLGIVLNDIKSGEAYRYGYGGYGYGYGDGYYTQNQNPPLGDKGGRGRGRGAGNGNGSIKHNGWTKKDIREEKN